MKGLIMNRLNEITVINKFKPLYVGEYQCLSYKKGKLYTHPSIEDKPILFGHLPMNNTKRFLSQFRITERLFRLEPRVAVPIERKKYLVSFKGAIYCADPETGTIACEHVFREGMNNPLNLCIIEGIDGFDNCIAYGEYWGNSARDDVSIYARTNNMWKKVFVFPKGTVRHIHGLVADPFRQCVLILTGDANDESGIWVARNNFNQVIPLLTGSQRYRMCVAFPVEEGILYATDIPSEANFIAIAKKNGDSWKEEILYDLPGPCIYGTKAGNHYVFATAVEPDENITGIRHWFTNRLGQGVKDYKTHIILGNAGTGFRKLIALKKDVLPMALFQYGNVQFPTGGMENGVIMYPAAVYTYDGKTVRCSLD